MNRKLLLAGLMSLCVASSAAAFAACSPEAPEAKEGDDLSDRRRDLLGGRRKGVHDV